MIPRQALSRWSAIAAILASFGLACAIARASSSDLTLLPFLLPIGLTLANLGTTAAYIVSPLAAFAWRTAHQPLAPPWATVALALLFALFTFLASRQQRRSRHRQDQLRHLSSLLPLCPNCGQLLCHDGHWHSLEQLLHNPRLPGPLPSHPCSTAPTPPDGPAADPRECP